MTRRGRTDIPAENYSACLKEKNKTTGKTPEKWKNANTTQEEKVKAGAISCMVDDYGHLAFSYFRHKSARSRNLYSRISTALGINILTFSLQDMRD